MSPYRPRPAMFAIDGALWVSLAMGNVADMIRTGSTGWPIFYGVLQMTLAAGAFKAFRFYRGVPDRESSAAP